MSPASENPRHISQVLGLAVPVQPVRGRLRSSLAESFAGAAQGTVDDFVAVSQSIDHQDDTVSGEF